ncbi:MAG TPA: hypothetical protein VFY39_08005 [Gammaproteobacteria bacterium]|nr:hypothetical protein [Gammaproteobacteria bacterium]
MDWTFKRNTSKHVPVTSAGIAVRTLLFGALPLEVYYAVPFQRPHNDRVTGFRIASGW